ncbi:MAG: HAMP domain-containing sensor histidine kinase [Gemmatimonadaceae bacterium]
MTLRARLQLHSLAVVALVIVFVLAFDDGASLRRVFLPAVAAAVGALALSTFVAGRLTPSIREMTEVAQGLAGGDLTTRPPLHAPGELNELASALGRLAEHLASRVTALRHEEVLLGSLVEALDEGVVTVDSGRRVTRMNAAARAILGIAQPVPFAADLLPRSRELMRAMDSALTGVATDPIETDILGRTVSLIARPLLPGKGILVALFDLTRVRRLETVRRDFVANVSHELKTPLTVIAGFAETLADDDVPEEMRRQFASTIHSNTERMRRIVDDLLDLSRLESGNWTPRSSDVDLREVAAEVAASYAVAAQARGLDLEITIDAGSEKIVADRTAVRQVLSNLVDNALRHTERGSVVIFGKSGVNGTWVGVSDTGAGIAPAHLTRIFERFYRVDSARARHEGGTGLGLAIVKHLIDAHGGRVTVESELGHGTTISVFFPS